MPDNLTQQFKAELKRRGITASNTEVTDFMSQRPDLFKSVGQPMAGGKIREYEEPPELLGGPIHAGGAFLWNAIDTALFSIPSITLGEDAPYKPEELGTGAKTGAVFGQALGFIAGFGKLSAGTKAISAAGKYGTKKAAQRAVTQSISRRSGGALKGIEEGALLVNERAVGRAVGRIIKSKPAKTILPRYEVSTQQVEAAGKEMQKLISSGLKKEFPKLTDDVIQKISSTAQRELGRNGTHLNSIASRIERTLNTKFKVSDKKKITAYIARAAEMTTNFSIYNLTDDFIKSSMVEGHEFDPVADVGHALMFSAFLPAIEAIPSIGGRESMKILGVKKIVKNGIDKIKKMDYDKMSVDEINTLFKIISNNNSVKYSEFAQTAAKNFSNAFRPEQQKIAAKHMKAVMQHFRPDQVMKQFYKEVGKDIGTSLPRMTVGALFFNASTLMDSNILRNVDPETLGAHLLTGALFTRRYKPIRRNTMPTLTEFDRKVDFLRLMGMDASELRLLGKVYDARANMAFASTGLLKNKIYRQINEAINKGEYIEQTKDGKGGVGHLDGASHSFLSRLRPLYIEGETIRKILNEDNDISADVSLKRLTLDQLLEIDSALRKVVINEEGDKLTEKNLEDVEAEIREGLVEGTYDTTMKMVVEVLDALGLSADVPTTGFNMNRPLRIKRLKGLRQFEAKDEYREIQAFEVLLNRLKAFRFVDNIRETQAESRQASDLDIKKVGPEVKQFLDEYERKITEDNYVEGVHLPDFDVANNAFLTALGGHKLVKTQTALYNIIEGKTDKLTKEDAKLGEDLYELIPRGKKVVKIVQGEREPEQWKKDLQSDEYWKAQDVIMSLSDLLNLGGHREPKESEITFEDAMKIVKKLDAEGYKIDGEMVYSFEKYYWKRLLNSSDIGVSQIAMIKQGIAHKVLRVVTEGGERIAKGVDIKAAKQILGEGSEEELRQYGIILNELKAVNGKFLKFESEFPLELGNEANFRRFIAETYPITTRYTRNIPDAFDSVRKRGNDSIEAIDVVSEVIDAFIDKTDPSLESVKPITIKEAQELSNSLKEIKRTAGDEISPEFNQLITNLERALSLTRLGEKGIVEINIEGINEQGGAAILAIRNAIDGEMAPHFAVNSQVARVILGLDTYVGDKISGKLRYDNIIADLVGQLKSDGIEVKDGATLSQLHSKFFNGNLSLEEKINKGITLSLNDFVATINDHMMSWNKGFTQEHFKEMADRHKRTLEDSSMRSRDVDFFSKLNSTVNKLKPHVQYFDSATFSVKKEELARAIKKEDAVKAREILDEVSDKVEKGYKSLYKAEPDKAKQKYEDFLSNDFRELLFGVAGTASARSVRLNYTNGQYLLMENKTVMSDSKLYDLMSEFESEGLYIAALEKAGIVLSENGYPTKVSNVFGFKNLDADYISKSKFSTSMKSGKERETNPEKYQRPEGPDFIRIPLSFNTQLVIPKNTLDWNKAVTVVKRWYDTKLGQLEEAKLANTDLGIKGVSTDTIINNFKALYGSEIKNDSALKQFIKAMHHDKMNSKGFHTFLTLATKRAELNAHMASDYKYFSLSEGMGAKIAGSTTAMRMLKEANENGRNANELVSDKEMESIDYYLEKGKLEGAVIEDEAGQMDALKLTESRLDALAKSEPKLKAAIAYTLKKLKNEDGDPKLASLKGRSTVDGLLHVGTHLWRLSLIQKARNENDGVGGIKEAISYNDGMNTALLKQNFIFDPRIASVIDTLGIDFLSYGSSAKVWSKDKLKLKESWEVKQRSLPQYFSEVLGSKKKALRDNNNVQDITLEDIQFVKSEDRHKVTNITYAASETLDKIGFKAFLDYAGYDTTISAADLMREGIVSKGPERYGVSEFVMNTLAEEGAIISGSTTSDVHAALIDGIDPRQQLVRDPINRTLYRRIINRIRNPQTEGASYSVMVPFLEGSLPVYSDPLPGKNSIQIRFGGKKLADADGKIPVNNFDEMQYIVNVEGREILVGIKDFKEKKNVWSSIGTGEDQLQLTKKEQKLLDKETAKIDKIINMYSEGTTIRELYGKLKAENIFLESASLRMPNLAGDVVINKVEDFFSPEMGNVVGINPVDLTTKMQADMDGDMAFNYHNMNLELTKSLANVATLKFDTHIYDPEEPDFGDMFQNGNMGYAAPVGSKPDAIEPYDLHNVHYYKGKDSFGQIKRFSAGINSLARTNFTFGGEKDIISFKDIDDLKGFLQRISNVEQSLIDTTRRPNMTNKHAVKDLKRFILFGDIPGDNPNFNPKKYNESGFNGLVKLKKPDGSDYTGVQREVMKDAVVEIVDALGRPSRIMSDIYDSSGRRTPDHADLLRMYGELELIEKEPSQYVFNKLVRKYDKERRDTLLELFFDKREVDTQQALRERILNNQFGRGGFSEQVMVEKRPFSFIVSDTNSLFDSTPAGYILKRLGNVNDTYQKVSKAYGAETKKLGEALNHVENWIALSDAKTHQEIYDRLQEADTDNAITIALTGNVYNTKISEMKYLEQYSVNYYLLGKNASGIRDYLRRNGRSNGENVAFMTAKLRRIEAIRAHMKSKEDGIIGELLKKDPEKNIKELVDYFKLSEMKISGKKPRLYRNKSNDSEYLYQELSYAPGKWRSVRQIHSNGTHLLRQGRYVILKNPLRFEPANKEETLDAYSLLMVTGEITPENIRGFSGEKIDIVNFINKSRILKAQISSLTAEAFDISKGHPEGSENWVIEKGAEDTLVKDLFERFSTGVESTENIGKDVIADEYKDTVMDMALYLIKPDNVFGKITYAKDRDVALPAFRVNKRIASAVLRYLRNNGQQDIHKDIVGRWGTEFRRRYSNIPDATFSSQFQDTIYRNKNTAFKEKSEIYNLIMNSTPSMLYRPAIAEALKDEISLGAARMVKETDIHGDIYKILRLGTFENIKAELSPYVDSKSTDPVSNIYCL
jgi:hypothetical protein